MNTQKSANSLAGRAAEAAETVYEIAQATATVTANLHPKHREPTSTPNSLQKILHRLGTAYGLGRERYRQRQLLMEMDDRQLKDIGITREQAEHEARKPFWKD